MSDPSTATRLYDLADDFHRLAPWAWMEETDLIAIRLPGMDELAYISIMGMAGNHTALALYIGLEALERFNLIHAGADLGDGDVLRLILESRQLQASFEGRSNLEKSELAEIKSLGRKYRGDNRPCFRSYHQGKAPGPVTAQEAEWLGLALEQVMIVAPRLRGGDFRTCRTVAGLMEILSREPAGAASGWEDRWIPFHRKDHEFSSPPCNSFLAAAVARHPLAVDLECAFLLVPNGMGPRFGERTYPYILMVADVGSGMIVGFEMLTVEDQSFEALIASVPDLFLKLCDKAKLRPRNIACAACATAALLAGPAQALQCKVKIRKSLPALDALMASMPF